MCGVLRVLAITPQPYRASFGHGQRRAGLSAPILRGKIKKKKKKKKKVLF